MFGSSGHKKKRAREKGTHPSRVSLARARSLFCPLLPSACYAGYYTCNYISLTCSFFFCFFLFHYLAPSICLEMILPSGQGFHKKHFKVPKNIYICQFQKCLANWALKEASDVNSTMFCGRLFHSFIVHGKNKNLW